MRIPRITPAVQLPVSNIQEPATKRIIEAIIKILDDRFLVTARAINANEVTQVSDVTQPVPIDGQIMAWENTDNTIPGNPKAFLVVNIGGNIYTFTSEELW